LKHGPQVKIILTFRSGLTAITLRRSVSSGGHWPPLLFFVAAGRAHDDRGGSRGAKAETN